MIAERIPQLKDFTKEEKWQLVDELEQELTSDDPTMQQPLKSVIFAELERRWQHYQKHPESAMTLDEARRRMFASKQ